MGISKIVEIYKDNENYLNNLEVSNKDKIKAFIFGYLISLLLVASPIIITAHFFIYSFYFELVVRFKVYLYILYFSCKKKVSKEK